MKTHTFRLGKYRIHLTDKITGVCDQPSKGDKSLDMFLIDNGDLDSLESAIHEALHAEGIPDKYLHDKEGDSDTRRLALFLWRLGYRKIKCD